MVLVTSLGLAVGAFGSLVQHVVADEPKVLGVEFSKLAARDLGLSSNPNRLRRRADTIYSSISDAQQSDLLYLISVTIGTPPQEFQLQLDTGSSDIWVPSKTLSICSRSGRCTNGVFDSSKSSTFIDIAQDAFQIQYVDGTQIQGDYFRDVLTVNGSSIQNMTLALATAQASQDNTGIFQGIVGVGFQSGEAIAAQTGRSYPSFVSMLKSSGHIKTQAYSLWLNDLKASTGSILFGGIDSDKYHGDLSILPIQPDDRSGSISSFTVVLDNFEVVGGGNSSQYKKTNLATPVILDSGTTLTYLPDNIANDVASGVGAVNSRDYGVVVPCNIADTPATINFGFGSANGVTIVAPIAQFVLPFPSSVPAPTFRSSKQKACIWGILPSGSDPNLLGDTFLRSAYVVYNLDGQQIGLAQTNFNATGSNIQEISETSSIPNAATTVTGASVTQTGDVSAYPSGGFFSLVNGGGNSAAPTVAGSGTFNLGEPTSTAKSAAHAVRAPSLTSSLILLAYPAVMALIGAAIAML